MPLAGPELDAQKAALRATMRELLASRAPAVAAAAGQALTRLWQRDRRLEDAEVVALYAATSEEVPTQPLFDLLRAQGVATCFPRCGERRLEFVSVGHASDLESGRYGIPAPRAGMPEARLRRGDIVLVPGLAFDEQGWRLGRGGGWYDRTFSTGERGPWLVGVGFSFQCIEEVPHDSRDCPVDAIVTETGLQWIAERE